MHAHRRIALFIVLSALALSALAAEGASASGTTAYTCVKGAPGKDFEDEHCKKQVFGGTGSYGHVAISINTKTKTSKFSVSGFTFKFNFSAIPIEVSCTTMAGSGNATNEEVGGEMLNTGSEISMAFSGCTVPKPAGKGCEIATGAFTLTNIKSKTEEMTVKYSGTTEEFGKFTIKGCSVAPLNREYSVSGTFQGTPEGATMTFDVGGSVGLKIVGVSASVQGVITESMESGGNGVAYTT